MTSPASSYPQPPASYRAFCANWRLAVKDRFAHPCAAEHWPQCLAVEGMSREALLALQRRRLADLIDDVVRHVPFYRRWAGDTGYEPGDVLRVEDLPITTKADYRRGADDFQSEAFSPGSMRCTSTSGSTGEPLAVRFHFAAADYSYCCLWRALGRYGLRPGDRCAYLWGPSRRSHFGPVKRRVRILRDLLRHWMNNTLFVSTADLVHGRARRVLDRIEAFRPVYLHGYVSALYVLARQMLDEGRRFASFTPRAAVTEAEQIDAHQRAMIEEAFGCRVIEHYGSMEFGNIAARDPDDRFRINEDMFLLERLPDGEAVITSLLARAYPFIRYRIGDLIELEEQVPEPLPYACLSSVVGRTADLLVMPDGGRVPGIGVNATLYRHLDRIRRFQIRQRAVNEFIIKLVLDRPLSETARRSVLRDLHELLGEQASITITPVDGISLDSSGKFRSVISDVTDGRR